MTNCFQVGHYNDQMDTAKMSQVLERQLLLQLGDRLRQLRKAQGVGTIEMAARVGIARNTLRAIENGDPAPSMGSYLRVMSALGVAGELALLAGDSMIPAPQGTAGARSQRKKPSIQVTVTADTSRHEIQDLQSLALHQAAVELVKADPAQLARAQATLSRWLGSGHSRFTSLWTEWQDVLGKRQWRKILGRSRRAQELRQSSPLVTLLPDDTRKGVLAQIGALKRGVVMSDAVEESEP
jgi:transcriptional regulator with XRE-family HTH domain